MIRSSHAPRSKAHRVLKALPVLAVLVSGCMVQQLSAQGSLTAPLAAQIHSRTAPGLRSSTAPVGSARALRAALPGSTAFGVAPFGLQTQTLDPGESDLAHPNMALATDPLLFGSIGFGDSSAPSTGIGFKQAGTFHFGSQPGGGFDAFSPARIHAARQNLESLFPLPWIFRRGLGGGANGHSASTLFSLATLSQMMRGDLYLPFSSSVGGLRFDYEDSVRPGPKMAGLRGGFASAMFTSSLLRNGMTFSAGALFGSRSTPFPAGGGFRSMAAAQKGTVPSLALRLSF